MSYQCILVKTEGAVATITLHQPDTLNALSRSLQLELGKALDELNEAAAVKVVILQGAGRAFCAGAQLESAEGTQPIEFYSRYTALHKLFYKFTKFRKPIIGSVHGYCLGLGLELALMCDLLISSEDTKFGEPEVNLGISYGFVRLPRLVGEKRAMWISLSGEMFTAGEAKDWGIVNKVVPRDQLDAETQKIARHLNKKSASAMWLVKEGMKASLSMDPQNAFVLESMAEVLSQTSADYRKGVAAFLAKEKAELDALLPATRPGAT